MYAVAVCMICSMYLSIYLSVYVCMYALCCMHRAACAVCMYCMEEAGRWTNIHSCLSFLRYVLCKHHGPWYKLLARDLRLFPSLVFTEYPLQILSAWCQCHACTAAWRDSTYMKVQFNGPGPDYHRNGTCMSSDLSIFLIWDCAWISLIVVGVKW